MGIEHERKFLLLNDGWRDGTGGIHCIQGYIATGNKSTVRVRLMNNRGILCIKERVEGVSRQEFEYEIPYDEACKMLQGMAEDSIVEKNRYLVKFAGKTWEIDEFLGRNKGLYLAEIELTSPAEGFTIPPWAGQEVTQDKRYYNAYLAKHPFDTWK